MARKPKSEFDAPHFNDPEAAREHLEAIRWPDGPVCPHCGGVDRIHKMAGKRHRPGLYACRDCNGHFTVTVGTVFERSKIALHMWFRAVYLLCSSKKGISSHQLHRTLGVTYKTAWFMSHRIREALRTGSLAPMGGLGDVVEANETFFGNIKGKEVQAGYNHKFKVLSLVHRESGEVRSFKVEDTTAETILPILLANIHRETSVVTDDTGQYVHTHRDFDHETVRHRLASTVAAGSIRTRLRATFRSSSGACGASTSIATLPSSISGTPTASRTVWTMRSGARAPFGASRASV
jgi:transposase-like protein